MGTEAAPSLASANVEVEELGAVGQHDGDLVALPHAERGEAVGHAIDHLVTLVKGQIGAVKPEEEAVRPRRRLLA